MSSDKQFTATGDADIGFQTTGRTIKTGVSVAGTVAGIVAIVPTPDGTGIIARGEIATTKSPAFSQHAGVYGEADNLGVIGWGTVATSTGVFGGTRNGDGFGIRGETLTGTGIQGQSFGTGRAVVGISGEGDAIVGKTDGGIGVQGSSVNRMGVFGESTNFDGVFGNSHHNPGAGVSGHNDAGGIGVYGESLKPGSGSGSRDGAGDGLTGASADGRGVVGLSRTQAGVVGFSDAFVGVWAESKDPTRAGLFATNNRGAGLAARIEGNVEVTGDIRLVNADCAEDFYVTDAETIRPGTVMVIDGEDRLSQSVGAYDKRVAGVVAGAGDYRPGIVLDKQESSGGRRRLPISVLGKVYCKVDANYCSIDVGDLLTTSPTPGHAMKVLEPNKAFGAVIGKALRSLNGGQGLIPILITLQ
jgi:hypothetical protein